MCFFIFSNVFFHMKCAPFNLKIEKVLDFNTFKKKRLKLLFFYVVFFKLSFSKKKHMDKMTI